MKTALTKRSFEFLQILFVIWSLINYYASLFRFDAPDAPTDLKVKFVENDDGLTMLRFTFGSLGSSDKFCYIDMMQIMQEYLTSVLLPSQKILQPYHNGTSHYDVVEALYIDGFLFCNDEYWLDIIYVDDPISYNYAKSGGMKGCEHKWYI